MTMAIDLSAEEKLARFGLTERDVERLVEALGHEDPHVRRVVRGALRGLGEAAVPALEKALGHADSRLHGEVSELLRRIYEPRFQVLRSADIVSRHRYE